jgi:carbon monoxide dehydrogenase subunit G
MELVHEFSVPVPVEQAWQVLTDVERIARGRPPGLETAARG